MSDLLTLTPQEMAGRLLVEGFASGGPAVVALSDPIANTPIVVTLDELRPYELNPRITRNPLYDDIKASIKERGLDTSPPITRRPGADHYIIRNGGNTRLAILQELWAETKDERFFRISCLFRPWAGEIAALTGHLAENELHGGLTFIERALGVEKARELYEQEDNKALSQSELARRLSADGYPVTQPHISRMQDTVRYLLPAIPSILYGGLGRHQVERLTLLRRNVELAWLRHTRNHLPDVEFETLFHDTLTGFDTASEEFSFERVRDELIGQLAEVLGVDYSSLELDIDSIDQRRHTLASPPSTSAPPADPPEPEPRPSIPGEETLAPPLAPERGAETIPARSPAIRATAEANEPAPIDVPAPPRAEVNVGPPVTGAGRLQAIQQLVTEHAGGGREAAEGLFPVTDMWSIAPSLDTPEHLRAHIAQFAREIAEEAQLADCITPVDAGIGFACAPQTGLPEFGRALWTLLQVLSQDEVDMPQIGELGPLLRGRLDRNSGEEPRLSDRGLVKLFRLLRLARRLLDREAGAGEAGR
jgi:ParB family protein of integrating conjugative element (PFGI_1 class)